MPVVLAPSVGSGLTEVILDPSEVAEDRTELPLNLLDGPMRVLVEGIDWGDSALQQYMADQAVGSSPVDFRMPNREVKIPLAAIAQDGDLVTYQQARRDLASKVARIQQEGGWLKRGFADGSKLYADVIDATLHISDDTLSLLSHDVGITLVLTCLPDFYGDEETLGSHSGSGVLTFTESNIKGDYPGRLRLDVTDTSGSDQLGLVAAVRSRHYSADSTAALFYEAEDLTPLDGAAAGADSGASGTSRVAHTSLGSDWTSVVSTEIDGVGQMTHTGSYRVRARVLSIDGDNVQLRLVWDVGDFTNPVENSAWTIPSASSWFQVDLGTVRIDKVPVGTHRWQGIVQAKGASGGESVRIDTLEFEPLDEGWTKLRALESTGVGLAGYLTRDEFNQTAGALIGKTAPTGDIWAAGLGSTTDFAVESTGATAQRTTISDATGRVDLLGSNQTTIAQSVDFKCSSFATVDHDIYLGMVFRWVDSSNFGVVYVTAAGSDFLLGIQGVAALQEVSISPLSSDFWYSLNLFANADGQVWAWLGSQWDQTSQRLSLQHSEFATGGTLESGKSGLRDANGAAVARTRNYDNFRTWLPGSDAVLFASQSAELRFDGHFREDVTGSAYGSVPSVEGDLLRIPPSGFEGRMVEFYVKPSRGDYDSVPDSSPSDGLTAQAYYRPSYLFLPSA